MFFETQCTYESVHRFSVGLHCTLGLYAFLLRLLFFHFLVNFHFGYFVYLGPT